MTPDQRKILITILATTDVLWAPRRFQRPGPNICDGAIAERRRTFTERGVAFVAGGAEADRQAVHRDLRALAAAGLLRMHGRDRERTVELTPKGDAVARSMAPVNRVDESWPILKQVERAGAGQHGFAIEADVLGIDSDDPDYGAKCERLADEALPLLVAGLVECETDAVGCLGYRLTSAGCVAAAKRRPRPPSGLPKYETALGQFYTSEYLRGLEARESWTPACRSLVVVPLSAGCWSDDAPCCRRCEARRA